MGVWSTGDIAVTEQAMTGTERYVTGSWRYARIEDAGHWMQLDAPETVNGLLLDFLGSERIASTPTARGAADINPAAMSRRSGRQ